MPAAFIIFFVILEWTCADDSSDKLIIYLSRGDRSLLNLSFMMREESFVLLTANKSLMTCLFALTTL